MTYNMEKMTKMMKTIKIQTMIKITQTTKTNK